MKKKRRFLFTYELYQMMNIDKMRTSFENFLLTDRELVLFVELIDVKTNERLSNMYIFAEESWQMYRRKIFLKDNSLNIEETIIQDLVKEKKNFRINRFHLHAKLFVSIEILIV